MFNRKFGIWTALVCLCFAVFPAAAMAASGGGFSFGPFRCGENWNSELARRHLGSCLRTSNLKMDYPRRADMRSMQFDDTRITVIENKIYFIVTESRNLATERGLRVGDHRKRAEMLYGKSQGLPGEDALFYTKKDGGAFESLYLTVNEEDRISMMSFSRALQPIKASGKKAAASAPLPELEKAVPRPPLDSADYQMWPLRLGDVFNREITEHYLGPLKKTVSRGKNETLHSFRFGDICVRGGVMISLRIRSLSMSTFRGLKKGDSFSRALSLYGAPAAIVSPRKGICHAYYGHRNRGMEICFRSSDREIREIRIYNLDLKS